MLVGSTLKRRNSLSGKTIQVADKGLNCVENILHGLKAGDGYLFSKSVKRLPETEQVWVLLQNDYRDVKNKKGELLYQIKAAKGTTLADDAAKTLLTMVQDTTEVNKSISQISLASASQADAIAQVTVGID